ncbi:Transposase [Brevibacterium linens ATCC 9172]|uniref:Transposase n=1 Tax=Brevibacterium linens ATCC 9172 TaxID=1255617 RepID=A0A2H1J606_BRELN|nr:Transposase [Brevibacterium linens ATCC 9172]
MNNGHASNHSYLPTRAKELDPSKTTVGSSRASPTDTGPASPGATFHENTSAPGKQCGNDTAATPPTAPGTASSPRFSLMPTLPATSIGTSPSMARSIVPTSTQRTRPALTKTQGATSNYKNLTDQETEPAGHGIGRSRGGLTTKIHHAVDGKGRPLAIVITGGQRHDGAIMPEVLADIRVPRVGPGRARTRPNSVLADRAYGSRANREYLRTRRVKAVIPEKSTQITARRNRGTCGGRRPAFNAVAYRNRNVVERSFAYAKQWRGLATRYDKLAIVYRAAVVISAILTWLR